MRRILSDCCANKTTQTYTCPECHSPGKPVSTKTLRHHLRFPENLNICGKMQYTYCSSLNCKVAYFSEHRRIYNQQLHSWPLIQQDLLCYCFAVPRQQYQNALKSGTATDIKQFVIEQTKNGNCACDVKNPGGHCCLAEFKHIEHKHQ